MVWWLQRKWLSTVVYLESHFNYCSVTVVPCVSFVQTLHSTYCGNNTTVYMYATMNGFIVIETTKWGTQCHWDGRLIQGMQQNEESLRREGERERERERDQDTFPLSPRVCSLPPPSQSFGWSSQQFSLSAHSLQSDHTPSHTHICPVGLPAHPSACFLQIEILLRI